MITPTVHLNGTSKGELRSQLERAHDALTAALEALAQAAPNARDYYPQGDGAFEVARREHDRRAFAVRKVRDELMAIWEVIEAQL